MKKKVWIINHYATGMLFQKGGRHYWFAKYLRKAGYQPVIFSCNSKHGVLDSWVEINDLWTEKTAEDIQVPFVIVQARQYQGNGKQRVLNMLDFYVNVKKAAKEYAEIHGRPDVILASSVHPLTLLAGIQLAKHYGVKCICEIRDLWPESIVVFNEKWTKKNLLIRLLYQGERYLYKRADALLYTFEGALDYIHDMGWENEIPAKKIYYLNNGIDLEEVKINKARYVCEDKDLDNSEWFKIVYTGSIRKVNNLDLLLDTAKLINNKRVHFLIWGQGNELERLKQRVLDEQISNVSFKGVVEKRFIPSIVSRADLCFAHNKATDMDYKYGISYNKVFDYLAGEKPILCDFPSKYNPVIQENAGFQIAKPEKDLIAETIDQIAEIDQEQFFQLCQNAKTAAQKYDFKVLTDKLISIIESV